jgi:hypothetical protein
MVALTGKESIYKPGTVRHLSIRAVTNGRMVSA